MGFPLRYEVAGRLRYLVPRDLLHEKSVLVLFTSRKGGVSRGAYRSLNMGLHTGDDPASVIANRRAVCHNFSLDPTLLTCAEQVHGVGIAAVGPDEAGRGARHHDESIAGADALITGLAGVPLAIFTADCLPIVLVEPERKVVAAVHAGRKSTYEGLAANVVRRLTREWACDPEETLAFLGPSIRGCCYDVGHELATAFSERFGGTFGSGSWLRGTKVDLSELNRLQLAEAGVRVENISSSALCTSCRRDMFFSYRVSSVTGRQAALVALA